MIPRSVSDKRRATIRIVPVRATPQARGRWPDAAHDGTTPRDPDPAVLDLDVDLVISARRRLPQHMKVHRASAVGEIDRPLALVHTEDHLEVPTRCLVDDCRRVGPVSGGRTRVRFSDTVRAPAGLNAA
jgi:hypothetical protein